MKKKRDHSDPMNRIDRMILEILYILFPRILKFHFFYSDFLFEYLGF